VLAQAYEQQAAANRRLRQYAATVENLTIIRERNRLVRELNDTLAHSLSAATVQLETVRSLWQVDSTKAQQLLDETEGTISRGLTESRRALQHLTETAAERYGCDLKLRLPAHIEWDLPSNVEQGVYHIAQEAVENAVRHAEARSIAVELRQGGSQLALTVQDDGQGIAGDTLAASSGKEGGTTVRLTVPLPS
jgi:signal transduction histidine kinase